MSWLGWLFLLAGLYVLVVVTHGLVQFCSWLIEEYIVEPRAIPRLREKPPQAVGVNQPATVPRPAEAAKAVGRTIPESASAPAAMSREERPAAGERHTTARRAQPHRREWVSRWGRRLRSLKTLSLRGGYDYWVACALAEDDRRLRVHYLSKALRANPGYQPAWGMKGHALFELGQYDEAIACFDKSLELRSSALVWYRRGLCFEKKGEYSESLRCFGRALEECPSGDRALLEEITCMKRRVEEQLRCVEAV